VAWRRILRHADASASRVVADPMRDSTAGRRRLGPLLLVVVLLAGAGVGGWWLGSRQRPPAAAQTPANARLESEVRGLRLRLQRRQASPAEQQRLLELLVALNRRQQAIAVLEPLADRQPERWSLRLLLAELRRDQGDRAGAERELRMILNRRADQMEALQLMTLLQLEQGHGGQAEAQVKAAYQKAVRPPVQPQALGLGLLLADLQLRRGQGGAATATYRQLASDFPEDQRPLIALALLREQQGDRNGALEALNQARQRLRDPSKGDPRLDRLAASWGLASLKGAGEAGSSRTDSREPRPAAAAGSTPESSPPDGTGTR
jgi:Flp pilus assembly protein TadD